MTGPKFDQREFRADVGGVRRHSVPDPGVGHEADLVPDMIRSFFSLEFASQNGRPGTACGRCSPFPAPTLSAKMSRKSGTSPACGPGAPIFRRCFSAERTSDQFGMNGRTSRVGFGEGRRSRVLRLVPAVGGRRNALLFRAPTQTSPLRSSPWPTLPPPRGVRSPSQAASLARRSRPAACGTCGGGAACSGGYRWPGAPVHVAPGRPGWVISVAEGAWALWILRFVVKNFTGAGKAGKTNARREVTRIGAKAQARRARRR